MKCRSVNPLFKTKNRRNSQPHRKPVCVPPPSPVMDVSATYLHITCKEVIFQHPFKACFVCNPSTKANAQTENAAFVWTSSFLTLHGSPWSPSLTLQLLKEALLLPTAGLTRAGQSGSPPGAAFMLVSQMPQTSCSSRDRRLNLMVHHHHRCGGLDLVHTSPFHTSHRARLTHPSLCFAGSFWCSLCAWQSCLASEDALWFLDKLWLVISAVLYVLLCTLSHHMDS